MPRSGVTNGAPEFRRATQCAGQGSGVKGWQGDFRGFVFLRKLDKTGSKFDRGLNRSGPYPVTLRPDRSEKSALTRAVQGRRSIA